MNIKKLHNLFLLPLLLGLLSIVMPGCSDDDENALQSEYGYVQFKLYKMNIKKLHNLFLLPLLLGLLSIVMPGCSDDDENALQSEYGYVQFKLYKAHRSGQK